MNRVVTALAALSLAGVSFAQDLPNPDLVLYTQDGAVELGPSRVLALPKVVSATWSSSGDYLLYEVEELVSTSLAGTTLHVVDVESGRSMRIVLPGGRSLDPSSTRWISNSPKLVLGTTDGSDYQVSLVDAASGKVDEFSPWGDYRPVSVFVTVSPTMPMAIVSVLLPGPTVGGGDLESAGDSFVEKTYRLDRTGDHIELVAPLTGFGAQPSWSADGVRAYVRKQEATEEGARVINTYQLDLQGGQPRQVQTPDNLLPNNFVPAGEVSARLVRNETVNATTKREVYPLWLETRALDGPNRVLVSGNAEWGAVSPSGKRVAYIAEGMLLVRPLEQTTRDEYEQALVEQLKKEAASEARAVGVALAIFATDNDGLLPPPSTFIEEVSPYLNSARALDRFIYTFPGGPFSNLRNPDKVELGFVPIAGGRMVLFADSSTKWVPLGAGT